jgi:hypothetical protein
MHREDDDGDMEARAGAVSGVVAGVLVLALTAMAVAGPSQPASFKSVLPDANTPAPLEHADRSSG